MVIILTGNSAAAVYPRKPTTGYHCASFYIAGPVHDRVAVGLGYFPPFGLGTVWPPTWAGRYITTYSSLKTYNVNPVVSVKVLKNLSLAAGFNV